MLLIILQHYFLHGILIPADEATTTALHTTHDYYWINFLRTWAEVGVNCFVLITGYFLIKSRFTLKKFLVLWSSIFFYSIIYLLLTLILNPGNQNPDFPAVGFSTALMALFPILSYEYWFLSTYVILCACTPVLNKLLIGLTKIQFQAFVAGIIFIQVFFHEGDFFRFLTLYTIAAYIRLHLSPSTWARKYIWGLFILSTSVLFLFCFCREFFTLRHFAPRVIHFIQSHCLAETSLTVLVLSVSLFALFLRIDIGAKRFINTVASCSLGVYLIHDNPFIRQFLWKATGNLDWATSPYLYLHCAVCVTCIYIVCTVIDYLRKIAIEPIFKVFIDKSIIPCIQQAASVLKEPLRRVFHLDGK